MIITYTQDMGRHDAAIPIYRRALALRPDFPEAFAHLVHSMMVRLSLVYYVSVCASVCMCVYVCMCMCVCVCLCVCSRALAYL